MSSERARLYSDRDLTRFANQVKDKISEKVRKDPAFDLEEHVVIVHEKGLLGRAYDKFFGADTTSHFSILKRT